MSVRVKIIMSKIFKDFRKEAFILVKDGDQNFKYVRDFENYIQKLFNIQFGIYLTIGDSLLPSCEHISVIHSDDTIIVNKLSEEISNNVNEPIEQQVELGNQSNDEANLNKRGKRIRKRRKKQTTENHLMVRNVPYITDELVFQPNKMSNKSKQPLKEVRLPTNDDGSSSGSGDFLTTNVATVSRSGATKSHIRFSDDTTDLPSSKEVVSSEHVDVVKARVVRPVTVLCDANAGSLGSPESKKSLVTEKCQRGGLVSLKEFANDKNFTEIATSIDFEEIVKSIDDSTEFIPLKDEPKVYDIISFKMLKIGRNYEPQLSDWIIAMVKDVEAVDIALHILAGEEETACPDGKLSMAMTLCDEEETEPPHMKTLKREDLLNIKVFHNK